MIEQQVSSLLSEEIAEKLEEMVIEKIEEEVAEKIEEIANDEPVEEQKMSDEDRMKQMYMEEVEKSNIQDSALLDNLKYMMNMGYLNFMVNYNLLTRNGNDLVVAINKLCNNLVTESIFEVRQ